MLKAAKAAGYDGVRVEVEEGPVGRELQAVLKGDRRQHQDRPAGDENPSVPCQATPESDQPDSSPSASQEPTLICRAPRPLPRPVSLKGRVVPGHGYHPENWQWFQALADKGKDHRRVGRDPMSIPPQVLIAAGHPPDARGPSSMLWVTSQSPPKSAVTATYGSTASITVRTARRQFDTVRSSTALYGRTVWGEIPITRGVENRLRNSQPWRNPAARDQAGQIGVGVPLACTLARTR